MNELIEKTLFEYKMMDYGIYKFEYENGGGTIEIALPKAYLHSINISYDKAGYCSITIYEDEGFILPLKLIAEMKDTILSYSYDFDCNMLTGVIKSQSP